MSEAIQTESPYFQRLRKEEPVRTRREFTQGFTLVPVRLIPEAT